MPLLPEILESWPPNGWEFFQPETNWHAPSPLQFNFTQQVNNIIAMRRSNQRFKLSTDYMTVAHKLKNYTCARLQNHPKFCVNGDPAQKKTGVTFNRPSPLLARGVGAAAAVAGVEADALVEWLGEGRRPVESSVSERRAWICADCDRNSASPRCPAEERFSWGSWITGPIARALRRYIGLKNQMNLHTTKDRQLGKCLACRCELQLKVHTPRQHILDNMSEEVRETLKKVPNCWVLTER